jgi:acetamidase/formamidase
VREGRAWFGARIPLTLKPNLGTISTMPPEGCKPSYAGGYGGDFEPKRRRPGEPSVPPGAGKGHACIRRDPHAAISDGIITGTGTGIECSMSVRARITLLEAKSARAARSSLRAERFISS